MPPAIQVSPRDHDPSWNLMGALGKTDRVRDDADNSVRGRAGCCSSERGMASEPCPAAIDALHSGALRQRILHDDRCRP